MEVLIISDIHANLTALDAVLEDVGHIDATWCLGDIVGYGPNPDECVSRICALPNLTCLLGNHDSAVIGNIDINSFNHDARISVRWTKSVISDQSFYFLKSMSGKIKVEGQTLAHGSPRHPTWEYLLDIPTILENFGYFDTPFCFVGHTHLPVIYHLDGNLQRLDQIIPGENAPIQLQPRAIINPGSVGQPRDRNPLAAYAVFDTETHILNYHRVAYDIELVQERMRAANLPQRHIDRLEFGW